MESFLSQNSAPLTTELSQNLSALTNPIAFSAPFSSTPSLLVDSLSPSTNAASLPSIPTRTLPLDAGVINIVSYGAIPNDGKDDTVAIQKVLDDNDGDRRRVIYFPNGVYDIKDPLHPGAQAALTVNDNQRTSFWGESRDGVIFRVADNHPDFQNPTSPKAIFRMSPSSGFGFHTSVQNITFAVGKGNPGAIGIQYFSNNGGTLGNIKIVSEESDGKRDGFVGLDLYVDNNGPTFIKNVEIIGFDTGIRDEWSLWGHTLETVNLSHQNKVGYQKGGQTVSIRNLTSVNDVPVLDVTNASGALTLIDANFKTASPASSSPAIKFEHGSFFVRNLKTTGYTAAIQSKEGSILVAGPDITEYSAVATPSIALQQNPVLSGDVAATLNLSVPAVPEIPWETNFNNWAGPQQFGGVAGDGKDDTDALQAAIDSGATTVYLPGTATWDINSDVYLRGNVQRLTAFSRLDGLGRFVVVDQDAKGNAVEPSTLPQAITIEHMWAYREIEHRSDRTLVVSDVEGGDITAGDTGKGDLFIQDLVGNLKLGKGRRAWAWQLNTEYGESPLNSLGSEDVGIINDGGQLWILGLKTEKGSVKIDTKNGGTTEVLGAHIAEVGNNSQTDEPIFRSTDSNVSYVNLRTSSFSDNQYKTLVSETRKGETRLTPRSAAFEANEFWATGGGVLLPVYVGRAIANPLPDSTAPTATVNASEQTNP